MEAPVPAIGDAPELVFRGLMKRSSGIPLRTRAWPLVGLALKRPTGRLRGARRRPRPRRAGPENPSTATPSSVLEARGLPSGGGQPPRPPLATRVTMSLICLRLGIPAHKDLVRRPLNYRPRHPLLGHTTPCFLTPSGGPRLAGADHPTGAAALQSGIGGLPRCPLEVRQPCDDPPAGTMILHRDACGELRISAVSAPPPCRSGRPGIHPPSGGDRASRKTRSFS